ncbi:MAG: undecaprenyl-diphosphate phosphatase [Pseudomonadota bacterium]
MPYLQLVVLAIVQGITEFLPISSSAHLILVPMFVDGWDDQGPLIDVASHVGTLLAVLIYFRSETAMLYAGGIDVIRNRATEARKLFLIVLIASVPFILVGGAMAALDIVDALRNPYLIGGASIFFGIVLWFADKAPSKKEGLEGILWREALVIGCAQVLASIPGTSRSGITMTAARFLGWSRPEAARFSMLLAIPTISAVGAFAGLKLFLEGSDGDIAAALMVLVLSFVVALSVIALFMQYTRRLNFTPFVIYRVALGIAAIGLAWHMGGAG